MENLYSWQSENIVKVYETDKPIEGARFSDLRRNKEKEQELLNQIVKALYR